MVFQMLCFAQPGTIVFIRRVPTGGWKMPHVTVYFVPSLVDQQMIDQLKRELQIITADALSDPTTVFPNYAKQENIRVRREEIFVR